MLAPFLSVTIAGSAFFRWLNLSQVRSVALALRPADRAHFKSWAVEICCPVNTLSWINCGTERCRPLWRATITKQAKPERSYAFSGFEVADLFGSILTTTVISDLGIQFLAYTLHARV